MKKTLFFIVTLLFLFQIHAMNPINVWDLKVWLIPSINSADYVNMFINPGPSQWSSARSKTNVFGFNTMNIDGTNDWGNDNLKQFKAANAFQQLSNWNLPITIGPTPVAQGNCYDNNVVNYTVGIYRNIKSLGGEVLVIDMGEPLMFGVTTNCDLDVKTTASITSSYMKQVYQEIPGVVIGDTEAYPSVRVSDQMIPFIQQLKNNGSPLQWFHLDINWVFMFNQWKNGAINPPEDLKNLNNFCKSINIPFGIIIDDLTAQNDFEYYNNTLSHLRWLQSVFGDGLDGMQLLFMSWNYSPSTPNYNIPETSPYTMTYDMNYYLQIIEEARSKSMKQQAVEAEALLSQNV